MKCPDSRNAIPQQQESQGTTKRFDMQLNHFLTGAAAVNRQNLFDTYDFGVPISDFAANQNTLFLYDHHALPNDAKIRNAAGNNGEIPVIDAVQATENCDAMNVIFVKNPQNALRQCYALVGGQYQGYHVQRWMRIEGEGAHGKINKTTPLHQVSRFETISSCFCEKS